MSPPLSLNITHYYTYPKIYTARSKILINQLNGQKENLTFLLKRQKNNLPSQKKKRPTAQKEISNPVAPPQNPSNPYTTLYHPLDRPI